eukprot:gene2867-3912_t
MGRAVGAHQAGAILPGHVFVALSGTRADGARFAGDAADWLLHARGRVFATHRPRGNALPPPIPAETIRNTRAEVYDEASRAGLNYGPLFQLVASIERDALTTASVLDVPEAGAGAGFGH